MPELPDVTVYVEALRERIVGARLERLRLATPFVLRSVDPPPGDVTGRAVVGVRRLGKRVVIELEDEAQYAALLDAPAYLELIGS